MRNQQVSSSRISLNREEVRAMPESEFTTTRVRRARARKPGSPTPAAFDALVARVRREIPALVAALYSNGFAAAEIEEALARALCDLGALDEFIRS